MTIIVPSTVDHVPILAASMRAEEIAEAMAMAGLSPLDATAQSLARAIRAWTWIIDGEPACMFGVGTRNIAGDTGWPWLITTYAVERHPMTFLRHCRECVDEMLRIFPHLENYVDARHRLCVRWLKWLGFTVHAPEAFGVAGLPFHRFEMRA